MSSAIFISYRREDSAPWAGRLYDQLTKEYPQSRIFLDVESIRLGQDFAKSIAENVAACDVMLAIVGPGWLDAKASGGKRRIDDPSDFVRIEIEVALKYDIRIVPVLVGGAVMPKKDDLPATLQRLANINALKLTHDTFLSDASQLIHYIGGGITIASTTNPFRPLWLTASAILNVAALANVVGDAVKWIDFFRNILATYNVLVREPIFWVVSLVWPHWWPPFPRVVIDWLIIWSGIWIAINIYHYQVSRRIKLFAIFADKLKSVSDDVFDKTGLNWMIVDLYAVVVATSSLAYQYVTLPIKYFYFAAKNRSPLDGSRATASRWIELLDHDISALSEAIRGGLVEFASTWTLARLGLKTTTVDYSEFSEQGMRYLQSMRGALLREQRALMAKLERHDLIVSARRVILYYLSIIGIFIVMLLVNHTAIIMIAS